MFSNAFATQGIPEERDENLVARLAQDVSLPPFVEKKIQIVSEEQEEDRLKVMDLSAAHCDEESRRKFLEEELLKIRTSRIRWPGAIGHIFNVPECMF